VKVIEPNSAYSQQGSSRAVSGDEHGRDPPRDDESPNQTASRTILMLVGIAAFAQPAIGRLYLAGHTAQARLLASTVVNGGWLNVTAITGGVLLTTSVVVAGVAVARSGSLPKPRGSALPSRWCCL
jgi:hypothetical protein